jgi:hypothetical protein
MYAMSSMQLIATQKFVLPFCVSASKTEIMWIMKICLSVLLQLFGLQIQRFPSFLESYTHWKQVLPNCDLFP